jgi:hypothetical protein
MKNDRLYEFWFYLKDWQKAALATLCVGKSTLNTPRESAELVRVVVEPEITDTFDGFGDAKHPLLLPIKRFLEEKPNAKYEDVFEHLSI